MSADDDPVTVLSEGECWSSLSSMSSGRLVTILGGQREIFPVNFVTQLRTVVFRTAQGTKLFSAVMGRRVVSRSTTTLSPKAGADRQGHGASAVGQRRHPRGR
jgi:Pyridoxamine 5'-phosphate oxidase